MDAHRLKYSALHRASRIIYRKNEGILISDEPWDNLIILDACRYDMFRREYEKGSIPGKLESRISRATCTPDFLKENFGGRDFKDTVYVTSNPYVERFVKDSFHAVISVWDRGWSERYKTVLPSTMYEYTLKAAKKYPGKRLIVHFMQPHYPFISDMGFGDTGIEYLRKSMENEEEGRKEVTVWKIIEKEKIDMKRVWEAYEENLRIALPHVKKLISILPGRNVATSDHGNAVGERFHPLIPLRVYGHPCGFRLDVLKQVPWLIYENNISTEEFRKVLEKEMLSLKIRNVKKKGLQR